MEVCDWCGAERGHGRVLIRAFGSYADTSFSIGWDCFAKLHALRKQIGDSSSSSSPGRMIQKEEEQQQEGGSSEGDTEEEARRRAFGAIEEETMKKGFEDMAEGKRDGLSLQRQMP